MPVNARVLCPVDFSHYSAAALKAAGNFAKSLGAEMIVLHAEWVDAPLYFTASQTRAIKAQFRRSRKAAQRHLEQFAEEHLPANVPRTLLVVQDDPVRAILRAVKEWAAAWVVMGTHGRTGLTKVRFGSVMESVLAQLSAPLITVGPRVAMAAPLGSIRKILCAVDFRQASRQALETAAMLSEKVGGELVAVHVVEGPSAESPLARARDSLCDWIKPEVRKRCSVREVIKRGNPAEQILRLAEELRADLVVLSAKPQSFLGSLFLGSNVKKVIRSASCPVLSLALADKDTGDAEPF